MLPTLLIGDYFFVSKYSYGYSRHSMPFSPPLFEGRIFQREPKRGDIAVFKLPRDGRTDYVKRIVGLPGDRLQMLAGVLHINGVPVDRAQVDDPNYLNPAGESILYRETMPGGANYLTLDRARTFQDDTEVIEVRPGHFFMMGDNRDNSRDSRFENEVGQVPAENLVGVQRSFSSPAMAPQGGGKFGSGRWRSVTAASPSACAPDRGGACRERLSR